jgi:tetratricopeptide (TPR) repeat protein
MSREERFENRQWNDAVRDVKRAYNQVSDLDWKLYEGEPERAAKHLRKALDDFNAAMTHVAKADVGEAQQGAVDDVNDGIKQLNDAVTALDNGDIDSAQSHYDKAAASFADAELILA